MIYGNQILALNLPTLIEFRKIRQIPPANLPDFFSSGGSGNFERNSDLKKSPRRHS
jgi:hypothetical protein